MCDPSERNRQPYSRNHTKTSAVTDKRYKEMQAEQATESYEFRNGFNPQDYKTDDERYEAEQRYNQLNKSKSSGGKRRTSHSVVKSVVDDVISGGAKRRTKPKSDGRRGTIRTGSQGLDTNANLGGVALLGG